VMMSFHEQLVLELRGQNQHRPDGKLFRMYKVGEHKQVP
jgi:hypothetical protein